MSLQLKPLHPVFAAEASGIDLTRPPSDADVRAINAAMNRHAVLVFRGQPLTAQQQPLRIHRKAHLTIGGFLSAPWLLKGTDLLATVPTRLSEGIAQAASLKQLDPSEAIAFRGCQALTPETRNSTHYFFAHAHNFLLDQPEVTAAIHAGVVHAFEEDKEMITRQHRNLELDPGFKMVPLGIDAALSQFRWLVDRQISAEQQA